MQASVPFIRASLVSNKYHLAVLPQATERIRNVPDQTKIVSILGKARSGKSFLLSSLAAQPGAFHSLPGAHDPVTEGADMLVVGRKIYVDVEGRGMTGGEYDFILMIPVLLLSDIVVLNIREAVVVVADILELIMSQVLLCKEAYEAAAVNQGLGSLIVVFRDADFFGINQERARRDIFGNSANVDDPLNEKRDHIRRAFRSTDVFCLPMAGTIEAMWSPGFSITMASEEFKVSLVELQKLIDLKLEVPRRLGGEVMTGPLTVEVLDAIVQNINQDGNAYKFAADTCTSIAMRMVRSMYDLAVEGINASIAGVVAFHGPDTPVNEGDPVSWETFRRSLQDMVAPIHAIFENESRFLFEGVTSVAMRDLKLHIETKINEKVTGNASSIFDAVNEAANRFLASFRTDFDGHFINMTDPSVLDTPESVILETFNAVKESTLSSMRNDLSVKLTEDSWNWVLVSRRVTLIETAIEMSYTNVRDDFLRRRTRLREIAAAREKEIEKAEQQRRNDEKFSPQPERFWKISQPQRRVGHGFGHQYHFNTGNNGPVTAINVSSGGLLDSIQLVHSNGVVTSKVEGNGGGFSTFNIPESVFIKQIKLRVGDVIDAIQFCLSNGVVSPHYGGNGGGEVVFDGNGMQLVGIEGSVGMFSGFVVVGSFAPIWANRMP